MTSRLAWKIGSWLALVFALVAYVGWHMAEDFNALHQEARLIESVNHESHHLHALEMALVHTVTPVRSFLIDGDWRLQKIFEQQRAALLMALDKEDAGSPISPRLRQASDNIASLARHIFSLPFPSTNLEGPILMREVDNIVGGISRALSNRHHELDRRVNVSMRRVSGMRMDTRNDFLFSILALFLLLAGLTAYLYLHMVHPLVHMRQELKKVSEGDFNIRCSRLSRDELGELALACNLMGKALREREAKLNHARNMAAHHEKMQALGLMAAGIAHEVGNPLAAASVSLETALRKLRRGNCEDAAQRMRMAMDELTRTETIIQNILDYGKPGTESDLAAINIESVAKSAVSLARMSPQRRRIAIKTAFRSSPPQVIANAPMLRQVLVNLLLNAMEACAEDGIVELTTENMDDGIAVNVCDNGPGIPAALHEDIFRPMFTTRKGTSGSGIGLAISRELMERMHGRLELVRSDHTGSHFRAWLPAGGAI